MGREKKERDWDRVRVRNERNATQKSNLPLPYYYYLGVR